MEIIIAPGTTGSYAAGTKIEGLPIKIGDTVEDAQKAFDTKLTGHFLVMWAELNLVVLPVRSKRP